jgi:hypothetical protein
MFFFAAFKIDKKAKGSLYFQRDVFLRTVLKVEDTNDVSSHDASATIDFGTKKSATFGRHHLVKVDVIATATREGEKIDEKSINFDMISQGLTSLNVQLKTSCPDLKEVSLKAKIGGNKFETEFVKNEDRFTVVANLEQQGSAKVVLQSQLESTFHSFARIDLTGKVDFGDSPKVIEISGKSADGEYNVEFKSLLEQTKGSIKMTAVVPIIGLSEKDLQVIHKKLKFIKINTKFDCFWPNADFELQAHTKFPIRNCFR